MSENVTRWVVTELPPGVEVTLGQPGDEVIRIDEEGAGPAFPGDQMGGDHG